MEPLHVTLYEHDALVCCLLSHPLHKMRCCILSRHGTAPEVYQGFLDGDFVAKETKHSFNEVPFDRRLEHIKKTGKVSGGL